MMVDSARNQPRLVFIRSAIRNLMLLTACVQLAQAQAPQRPAVSMSAPACSVKQVNDSKVFNGRVHTGERYRCAFTPGLNFDLVPVAKGWQLAIRDDQHEENLARLTPPFNGQLPFPIQGSDFLKVGNTAKVDLPQKREFVFADDVSQYSRSGNGRSMSGQVEQRHGVITITDVQLNGYGHDQNPDISELAFEVSIQPQPVGVGGVYRVGGNVSAPTVIYAPDPEYSEQARKARYQGKVVLWMIISAEGQPRDIRVARSLGMGLDEAAIETVRTWRFKPAMRDGRPVAVQVNVEVTFRL
jgi:TonB family protein